VNFWHRRLLLVDSRAWNLQRALDERIFALGILAARAGGKLVIPVAEWARFPEKGGSELDLLANGDLVVRAVLPSPLPPDPMPGGGIAPIPERGH
jgi:hypothetical protein